MFEQMKKTARLLFEEGLVGAYGGSISVKKEGKIFITKKNANFADLAAEAVVELKPEDQGFDAIHAGIYNKTSAQAIIFGQPASAIAISLTDNKIVPQDLSGLSVIKSAPIVRARENEVARMIPNFLTDNKVAVVKGWGSFAVGQNLEEAYLYTSVIERSCNILVAIRSAVAKSTAQPRDQHQRRTHTGIPPGIGVMDRSRERGRFIR